jgi:basic membrane lipoprotein Med (substrate-binding protein (PBP1-ABC) superfamily)
MEIIRITLIRMTRLLPIFLTAALVLGVAGFVLPAEGQSPAPPRFVVVVDESAGRDQAAVDAATRAVKAARGADGELRITRTPTEQLSVTSYFAARGFDVIGVGLDREIAVDPVAERYPDTRFTLTDSGGLPSRAAAAAATR